MKKIIKKILIILISIILIFLSYKLCFFIAEKYFFDKIIYRKSIVHGYRVRALEINLFKKYPFLGKIIFGQRVQYNIDLNSDNKSTFDQNSYYKIAIIGDSYVWGTGIQNSQRFASLLETKLNKIRPTKIISVSEPGNNLLNYLYWSNKINDNVANKPDLYIIGMVENDSSVNTSSIHFMDSQYQNIINSCQEKNPDIKPINLDNINIYQMLDQGYNNTEIEEYVYNLQKKSWENLTNVCILEESIRLLPTTNSIYFATDDYEGTSNEFVTYKKFLEKTNKYVLSSSVGKNIEKYSSYWNNPNNNFKISQVEGHPNALANQMYADVLYNEITTNSKWNFIKP